MNPYAPPKAPGALFDWSFFQKGRLFCFLRKSGDHPAGPCRERTPSYRSRRRHQKGRRHQTTPGRRKSGALSSAETFGTVQSIGEINQTEQPPQMHPAIRPFLLRYKFTGSSKGSPLSVRRKPSAQSGLLFPHRQGAGRRRSPAAVHRVNGGPSPGVF